MGALESQERLGNSSSNIEAASRAAQVAGSRPAAVAFQLVEGIKTPTLDQTLSQSQCH